MPTVYSRKRLPMKGRCYSVTNQEQHDLVKKFPECNVELCLLELQLYLTDNPDMQPSTGNKTKNLIHAWFSGASATR